MTDDVEFHQRMQKIESLVHEIEAIGDERVRARAVELVSLLMELHAAGLGRLVELLTDTKAAQEPNAAAGPVQRLAHDPLVASLLLLHGLHPVELDVRVRQALDQVRPMLRSHGGNVELLGIDQGVVHLRLEGSCHGCPSSAQTLKNAIEEAIYEFAPDVVELQVDGAVPPLPTPGDFVPLQQLA